MTTLQSLARRLEEGAPLTAGDAPVILESSDLITIGLMADQVRRRLHGADTTFARVFEIHARAVPATLPVNLTAGEFRLVGFPESVGAACAAVAAARQLAGPTPLCGFSLAELAPLGETSPGIYRRLKEAGLDAISEVPLDRLPAPVAAVQAASEAGLLVQRITVHAPPRDAAALISSAVELQRATGVFRAFAPLPRTVDVTAPTTGYDDVKLVALARLLVRDIPSVQVDWPLYGPKLAQVALTMGADDVDGVVPVESAALGPRRSALEEIRRNIRAAGLHPVERNGRFERAEQADHAAAR